MVVKTVQLLEQQVVTMVDMEQDLVAEVDNQMVYTDLMAVMVVMEL